ncbi:TPA_asm: type VII secretion protein EssA [Listeria monocytogenes]|nr:type VII secretion protein EssA [Listeria monocytogenes]
MKFKIAALLIFICFAYSPGVFAAESDSYLDNSGKMDIKTDRLQKTEEEKAKELEKMEETELDKNGLPLFTDEWDEKVTKQKETEKAAYDRMKDSLFEKESTSGQTVKSTKEKLFSGNYETVTTTNDTTITVTNTEDETKKTTQKTVGGAVAGTLVALAGGIYVAARNVFE